MQNNTFSIIIPTFNRAKFLARILKYLENQTYSKNHFEVIIIDDGSTDNTTEIVESFDFTFMNINYSCFSVNKGKLAARNAGMKLAKNDWIVWIDSDDEVVSTYLESFNRAINKFPDHDVFNCGFMQLDHQNYQTRVWIAYEPPMEDGKVMPFQSGQVTSGSFIFKRKLIDEVGYLPESKIAYGSEDSFAALAAKKWPAIKVLYGQDTEGDWIPFGNPFGDDYYFYFVMTHIFQHVPKAINLLLYIQNKR